MTETLWSVAMASVTAGAGAASMALAREAGPYGWGFVVFFAVFALACCLLSVSVALTAGGTR